MQRLRNANIGICVGAVVLLLGVAIGRGDASEAFARAVGLIGFITALVVMLYLDERDARRGIDRRKG